MKVIAIILVLVSLGFSRVIVMDSCLKEVDAIFKTMYGSLPDKGSVVYVNYEIITTTRPQTALEKEEIRKTDIKTYTSENQYRFISNDIEVYQDKEYAFTVIPSRKVIYWAQSDMNATKNDRMKQMKKLQDTLFNNCQTVSCSPFKTEKGATKLITMIPNKKWSDLMQIELVNYYVNSEKKELVSELIQYTKYKKLKSVEYVFKETDYDYKKINLNTPVKQLFIESRSSLVDAYRGYKLIDVRKKK